MQPFPRKREGREKVLSVRRKYALESNVSNPAAGFKSKPKITTAYLLQRKNPVNYSLLLKYFKGRLRSRAVRLRRRLRIVN